MIGIESINTTNNITTISKKLTLGISVCIFMTFLGIVGIFALKGNNIASISVYYLVISLVFIVGFIFTIYQARLYCKHERYNQVFDY